MVLLFFYMWLYKAVFLWYRTNSKSSGEEPLYHRRYLYIRI